jgi:hypothetical protein
MVTGVIAAIIALVLHFPFTSVLVAARIEPALHLLAQRVGGLASKALQLEEVVLFTVALAGAEAKPKVIALALAALAGKLVQQ